MGICLFLRPNVVSSPSPTVPAARLQTKPATLSLSLSALWGGRRLCPHPNRRLGATIWARRLLASLRGLCPNLARAPRSCATLRLGGSERTPRGVRLGRWGAQDCYAWMNIRHILLWPMWAERLKSEMKTAQKRGGFLVVAILRQLPVTGGGGIWV